MDVEPESLIVPVTVVGTEDAAATLEAIFETTFVDEAAVDEAGTEVCVFSVCVLEAMIEEAASELDSVDVS